MRQELLELIGRMNHAGDGVRIDSEYLLIVARKPG
jgi:hypothetical protein